jgi:hypothetical protein
MTLRLEEIWDRAMAWARHFLDDYSTIHRSELKAYAQGLLDRSLVIKDPEEALWAATRGEALRGLIEETRDEDG